MAPDGPGARIGCSGWQYKHWRGAFYPADTPERLFSRARRLGRTLGPVLYQLPPRWSLDIDRLETFVRTLPKRRRHAIEFRDPSWYTREVFTLLDKHRVALCLHDMAGSA